ncbi:SpaH/EbpB family LPXTG-anchored major pilin [Ruminococcaceae bacterium OttesenSCG-928-A16]|nr:SpaH/EbpB family LPXTG-anchored major pilin [Ruminococcaceae bacterium OttesenSCG-928-A16]
MSKRIHKKVSALLLAACMALVLVPSMVFAGEAPPVEAPVMPEQGTLVIHKYKIDDPGQILLGTKPGVEITDGSLDTYETLSGIEFSATKVKPAEDGSYPETAASVVAEDLEGTPVTATTGPGGLATMADLPAGVYLVKETNSGGYAPIAPFLVQVPMTNENGNGWLETVHVYPKNQTMNPSKKADGESYDPLNPEAKDSIEWTIHVPIPVDMSAVTVYKITDVIDDLLELDTTGTVKVSTVAARDAAADAGTPVADTNYSLDRANNTLTVEFNENGIAYLGQRYAANEPYVRVVFSTKLTADALGKLIDNQVTFDFTNDLGDFSKQIPPEEVPQVYTGAIKVNKTDKEGGPLAGATFKVATTLQNAKDGIYLEDHEGNEISATTNTDGVAILNGISYGAAGDKPDDETKHGSTKFYLVEVQAPDGYNLLHEPIEVGFNYEAVTDLDGNIINFFNNGKTSGGELWKVVNTKGFTLPETGAAGIILSTAVGVVLLGMVIVVVARRKLKQDDV